MVKPLSTQQLEGLGYVMASSAKYVIGVDEVGLGAIAGPLYVVGAVFLKGWGDPEVRDSKKFNGNPQRAHANRRKVLVSKILPNVVYQTTLFATTAEIDKEGPTRVLARLTKKAVLNCLAAASDSIVVLDGKDQNLGIKGADIIYIVKADALVPAVSAASIIAKTSRDELMETFDEQYPYYGFRNNRGYPSEQHKEALDKMGVCPLHRRSYDPVKKAIAKHGPATATLK